MVTGVEVEPCAEMKPASPELRGVIEEARRHIADGESKFQPVSVADVISDAARIIDVTNRCVTVCFLGLCYQCCHEPISGGGVGGSIEVCGGFLDPRR
jgi:hypothetical protein